MLMEPVPAQEMPNAALVITRMWQRDSRSDSSWLAWVRQRHEQRFVLLTLCRALYTLEYGTLASKSAAARWAQETLARKWAMLIARSLTKRDGTAEVTAKELKDTLTFIDDTANRLLNSLLGELIFAFNGPAIVEDDRYGGTRYVEAFRTPGRVVLPHVRPSVPLVRLGDCAPNLSVSMLIAVCVRVPRVIDGGG
jgi:hypothetical protein